MKLLKRIGTILLCLCLAGCAVPQTATPQADEPEEEAPRLEYPLDTDVPLRLLCQGKEIPVVVRCSVTRDEEGTRKALTRILYGNEEGLAVLEKDALQWVTATVTVALADSAPEDAFLPDTASCCGFSFATAGINIVGRNTSPERGSVIATDTDCVGAVKTEVAADFRSCKILYYGCAAAESDGTLTAQIARCPEGDVRNYQMPPPPDRTVRSFRDVPENG